MFFFKKKYARILGFLRKEPKSIDARQSASSDDVTWGHLFALCNTRFSKNLHELPECVAQGQKDFMAMVVAKKYNQERPASFCFKTTIRNSG